MVKYTTEQRISAFWAKVNRTNNPDDCWEWQNAKSKKGYGLTRWIGRKSMAHAHCVSWMLSHGAIPDNLFVLHSCDNPSCCNPKHLFLGTNADNMRDRGDKNRQARQYGETNPNVKLTREQVEEIRRRYIFRKTTHEMLAIEFGVSRQMIGRILRGENWTNDSIHNAPK